MWFVVNAIGKEFEAGYGSRSGVPAESEAVLDVSKSVFVVSIYAGSISQQKSVK